jgi:hypothetical protein
MHIAYIDESGDLGGARSPTRHFILCAVVVRHEYWAGFNEALQSIRSRLHERHGLRLDAEIHTSQFLGGSELHLGMEIKERFQCMHHVLVSVASLPGVRFARICVEKTMAHDIMDRAWFRLLSEINQVSDGETTCQARGLILLCDHHNTLPYRPPASSLDAIANAGPLLELPLGRDSKDSHALQLADILVYLTRQSITPNAYFSKSRGRRLLRMTEALFGKPCPRA